MFRASLVVVVAAAGATRSPAQGVQLVMSPAVAVGAGGTTSGWSVTAPPAFVYGLFVDLAGGPVDVLGERVYLGLSPWLTALNTGIAPASGSVAGAITVPASVSLAGLVVYGQAIVLDATAANGVFRASNGASTTYFGTGTAIVAAFDNPVADGYTGTFATDVPGHLHGGPVLHRRRETNDLPVPGYPFWSAVQGELTPFGGRGQHVYRALDLAATGEPELVTALYWRPFAGSPVQPDVFPQFEMRIGHTAVTPDYSLDAFSALPVHPNSGLSANFAANELAGAPPALAYQGALVIDPATAIVFGPLSAVYLPLPMTSTFVYDGVSSLLLDLRVAPSNAAGVNGFQVGLMVQSSALPSARAVARGSAGSPLAPASATIATITDCSAADLLIDFARVHTFALSPWLDSQVAAPDYLQPVLAQSLPAGTAVSVEYRGAGNASGASATAWSPSPDVADGQRFLQFRITMVANHLTGERPVVDTLVVPIQ